MYITQAFAWVIFLNFMKVMYNISQTGDDRLRRERLVPDCEPRGTDLVKSVQKKQVPKAQTTLHFL